MSEAPGPDWQPDFFGTLHRLMDEAEDQLDAEDADEAWDKRGKDVPLADLLAELG